MEIHPIKFKKDFKQTIRFEKVKQLKIEIFDKRDGLGKLPFIFDQLEELDLKSYWSCDDYIEFAYPNNLKKLKLYSGCEPSDSSDIASQWPSLEEISMQMNGVDDATYLMDDLEHLKKMEMYDCGKKTFAELKSVIGEEWKIDESEDDGEYVITITKK